jgi:hypothetical protein
MTHNSYMEYFSEMKKVLSKTIEDRDYKKYFLAELLETIKWNWDLYENEECSTYMLDEEQLSAVHETAKNNVVNETLCSLSDKGLISVSVNCNGELVYSITDEGLNYLESQK